MYLKWGYKTSIKPIKFNLSNTVLKGKGENIEDLYVFRNRDVVISCWKIPLLKRLSILINGKIWLCVKGQTHPPLYLETKVFTHDKNSINKRTN